jgi:hypothetical protein
MLTETRQEVIKTVQKEHKTKNRFVLNTVSIMLRKKKGKAILVTGHGGP